MSPSTSRWRSLFIGLLDPLAWLLEKIFPARKQSADPIGAALSR